MEYIYMGKQGRDKITGFRGTVVAFAIYISGCNQVLLSPNVKKDGAAQDSHWFDEQRVTFSGQVIKLDNRKTPGPDKSAPIR